MDRACRQREEVTNFPNQKGTGLSSGIVQLFLIARAGRLQVFSEFSCAAPLTANPTAQDQDPPDEKCRHFDTSRT